MALKKTRLPQKQIRFIAHALQHVAQNGFHRVSRMIPNTNGFFFTLLGDQTYYVTQWIEGQTADFSSVRHVAESALTIAEFHRAARGFVSVSYQPESIILKHLLQTRTQQLDQFLTKAKEKRKPDDVDRFVLRYLPAYKKQALQAVKLLNDPRVVHFLKQEEEDPGLAHLDITPTNLIFTPQNQICLIDFDRLSYAPRMLDIGHMMRRSLQANRWQREFALISLVQVNQVEPLRHAEYTILQSILTFPHSVWRNCRNHYLRKSSPYTLAALEQLQEQEADRQSFLEDFAAHVERHKGP
ncbi:spore coat protein [Effusibacillus dendaii]|uniref:Spore coat protein n=1 Tax=Effusibacillus dendaii TaxID=2743772 RepID=A0A7I8DGP2_9BACL|nr:spore coat protein [Effusibacillus dendaii]